MSNTCKISVVLSYRYAADTGAFDGAIVPTAHGPWINTHPITSMDYISAIYL